MVEVDCCRRTLPLLNNIQKWGARRLLDLVFVLAHDVYWICYLCTRHVGDRLLMGCYVSNDIMYFKHSINFI
jgi:hypothetical protein